MKSFIYFFFNIFLHSSSLFGTSQSLGGFSTSLSDNGDSGMAMAVEPENDSIERPRPVPRAVKLEPVAEPKPKAKSLIKRKAAAIKDEQVDEPVSKATKSAQQSTIFKALAANIKKVTRRLRTRYRSTPRRGSNLTLQGNSHPGKSSI